MASPAPEAAPSNDPKPLDAAPSKELKSEANGHASPVESSTEPQASSEKPLINGDGNAQENGVVNGIDKGDVTMGNTDHDEVNESAPSKIDESPAATSSEPQATGHAPEQSQPASEISNTVATADVDMSESKPTEAASQPDYKKDEKSAAESTAEDADAAKDATTDSVPQNDTADNAAPSNLPSALPSAVDTPPKTNEEPLKPEEKPTASGEAAVPPSSDADLQPASLSQLEIESEESKTSPIEESVEVSMTDAPGVKVAREREEDAVEEPAPKRAKTEPKEDEPTIAASESAATPVSAAAPMGDQATTPTAVTTQNFDELPKWNDPDWNAKTIQPFQLRDMRRSMARVKKTKNGSQFRDSVQKLWPDLWDKYSARIDKPMDLGEIDRNLRDNVYKTFGDFKNDLVLINENAKTFNGPDHYITAASKAAIRSVWDDVMAIPEEEPVKQKAPPKQNRLPRESRSAMPKPEEPAPANSATGGQASQPAANSAPKSAASTATVRRTSSTVEGDRPKRTVRAPKPKDIDYTPKPSRKKLKPELQFCDEVLAELMSTKLEHLNKWFNDPVDVEGLGIPHYYSIISHPMDFGKIYKMIHDGEINSLKEFDKNVNLVFDNCYKFNGPPEPTNVSYLAKQLDDIYKSQMKNKDTWMAKHAKANHPPQSASNDSDDEDDEDDEEAENHNAGPDPSKEVKELEARLREEMAKQTDLFAAEQPNQAMIQIQQGIVGVVQQALLQAKQKLNEFRKNAGTAGSAAGGKAKKSKPNKSKAAGSGGAGRKASGAAAQPKKTGGAGGQKKKKNLTAADKDNIAGAINDLEYPHLDRAIDIIKRDTGQMESEDGELELDIDQLSNEALLKLWELCKKVLPGFGKDSAAVPASSPEVNRTAPAKQAPKTAAKPKKNKPMSAQEQEARIAQLREIRDLYKPGQEPADEAQMVQEAAAMNDTSDDSSEEE